uniref:histidine kinase n=1 Tax=Phaeomonas parva TaxID=124430 RepID=A0A7S1UA45_9STRA|mmetsp:Transcript_38581/g.120795  ORF Transcript_38581/g.120795 Transcript_38581/m.120795 type:complete len:959 (+) Transcript_38581:118-2994(+)
MKRRRQQPAQVAPTKGAALQGGGAPSREDWDGSKGRSSAGVSDSFSDSMAADENALMEADALAATKRAKRFAQEGQNRVRLAHLPIAFGNRADTPSYAKTEATSDRDQERLRLLRFVEGISTLDRQTWLGGGPWSLQFEPELEDAYQTFMHLVDDESQTIVVIIAMIICAICPRMYRLYYFGGGYFNGRWWYAFFAVAGVVLMKAAVNILRIRRMRDADTPAEAVAIRGWINFGRVPILIALLCFLTVYTLMYATECGNVEVGHVPIVGAGPCISLETSVLPTTVHFYISAGWVSLNLALKSSFQFTCITSTYLAIIMVYVCWDVDLSVHDLDDDSVQRVLACFYLLCPNFFFLGMFYHFERLRRQQFLLLLANKEHVLKAMDARRRIHDSARFLCHELRNPLQSILGGLRSFTTLGVSPSTVSDLKLSKEDMAMLETVWIGMVSGVQQLTSVTNDVLDFERISAGRLPFQFEKVRLSDTLEEVVKMFRTVYEGVRFVIDVEEDVVTWTDPRRVRQILMNGVSYAIKYTVPKYADKRVPGCAEVALKMRVNHFAPMAYRREWGLESVSANGDDKKLRKMLRRERSRDLKGGRVAVEMIVVDNGPGLERTALGPERQRRVHQRNMGMQLSSAIAEALQGFIAVKNISKWDAKERKFRTVGARFTFSMPLDPDHTTILDQKINRTIHSVALLRSKVKTEGDKAKNVSSPGSVGEFGSLPDFDESSASYWRASGSNPNKSISISEAESPARGAEDSIGGRPVPHPNARAQTLREDAVTVDVPRTTRPWKTESSLPASAPSSSWKRRKNSNNFKYKTMLIEDDETVRMLAQYSLRQCRAAVRCVDDKNLDERVSEITSTSINGVEYDVVFIDIVLGAFDGRDVCHRLRKHNYCKAIVAATANTSAEDVASYKDAGFDGVLPKPYMQEDLLEVLSFYEEIDFARSPFTCFEPNFTQPSTSVRK